MKAGVVIKPNEKGQIVIPKEMRDALGIDSNIMLNLILAGKGIYIYPIKEIITNSETENSYAKLLEKTQGAWEDKEDPLVEKREQLELEQAAARKKPW